MSRASPGEVMKRISYWILSTVSAVALLFAYHTSRSSQMPTSTEPPYVASGPASASRTSPPSASRGSAPRGATGPSSRSRPKRPFSPSAPPTMTVTGSTIETRWGPVQVQLSVSGAKITKVTVLQYPNGTARDAEINSQALPILIQETQNAQSAQIEMVSGATYTSGGYIESLQSALDKVHA